jgi:hypothetical protein
MYVHTYIRMYVCTCLYTRIHTVCACVYYICTYTYLSACLFPSDSACPLYTYICYVDVQVNKAATFSGSNYLQTTTSFDLGSLTAGVSVSCWFKFTGTGNYPRIIDFGYSGFSGLALGRHGTSSNLALMAHYPEGTLNTISVTDGFPSGMYV